MSHGFSAWKPILRITRRYLKTGQHRELRACPSSTAVLVRSPATYTMKFVLVQEQRSGENPLLGAHGNEYPIVLAVRFGSGISCWLSLLKAFEQHCKLSATRTTGLLSIPVAASVTKSLVLV